MQKLLNFNSSTFLQNTINLISLNISFDLNKRTPIMNKFKQVIILGVFTCTFKFLNYINFSTFILKFLKKHLDIKKSFNVPLNMLMEIALSQKILK